MSKVTLVNTNVNLELGPGKTGHWHWNNATPSDAVWYVNAVPFATGSTLTGFAQDTQLEVTRVWRRFIVTEHAPPNSQISDTTTETEIHYEIKNLGGTTAKFNVFLSIVYD
ncbi:MAG TPA: hypothetical protein VMG39_08935 [Pseudolabrys sp.]|nr:hypothetical protein [Pseudolabrys sp.]